MSGPVQFWPLLLGWTIVAILLISGFRRHALIAGAGMAVVSYYIIGIGTGWSWMPH